MKSRTGITILIISMSLGCGYSQIISNSLKPGIDTRVELVTIACRLADVRGFNGAGNSGYISAVNAYFGPYRSHAFVSWLAANKKELDESYWEIAAAAVHVTALPELKPVIDYNDLRYVDDWESRKLFNEKFVTLLQAFYRDSKAERFFSAQEHYYQSIEKYYEQQSSKLNKKWFDDFFGLRPTENYYAIIALGMSDGAYMRVNYADNRRDTFTFFACTSFDSQGRPDSFSRQEYPRSLLHEYLHCFTNQVVDGNISALQISSEIILKDPKVFSLFENTFYGNWQFLLYESMVRACTIKYLERNKEMHTDRKKEIAAQEKAGFVWMDGLVKELDYYEAHREEYPNLGQYMPRIVLYFKNTAEEIKSKK